MAKTSKQSWDSLLGPHLPFYEPTADNALYTDGWRSARGAAEESETNRWTAKRKLDVAVKNGRCESMQARMANGNTVTLYRPKESD